MSALLLGPWQQKEKERRKVAVTSFHLPLQSDCAGKQIQIDSQPASRFVASDPSTSTCPPTGDWRPAGSQFGQQALVWAVDVAAVVWKQPGSGSPPSTSGHCIQKEFLSVRPAALTVYRPGQRKRLAFIFTHTMWSWLCINLQSCSSWTPGPASLRSDPARHNKQGSRCMCSFCLLLGSASSQCKKKKKNTLESSGATLIRARENQCHYGIVEVDQPLKLCSLAN